MNKRKVGQRWVREKETGGLKITARLIIYMRKAVAVLNKLPNFNSPNYSLFLHYDSCNSKKLNPSCRVWNSGLHIPETIGKQTLTFRYIFIVRLFRFIIGVFDSFETCVSWCGYDNRLLSGLCLGFLYSSGCAGIRLLFRNPSRSRSRCRSPKVIKKEKKKKADKIFYFILRKELWLSITLLENRDDGLTIADIL